MRQNCLPQTVYLASSTQMTSVAIAAIVQAWAEPHQRRPELVSPVPRRGEPSRFRFHSGNVPRQAAASAADVSTARGECAPAATAPPPTSSSWRAWNCSTVARWLTLTKIMSGSSARMSSYSVSSRPSSSAEVDSSRNTARGLVSRMRAKAMRCCSPTESTFAPSPTSLSRIARCGRATLIRACWISRSPIAPSSFG